MNSSGKPNDSHCPANQDSGTTFMPAVMIAEMIVGLPINIVALWIFCFRMKFWKPHAVFLFNLLLADFLLLVSVPLRIDNHLRGENWVFGHDWCRVNLFMLAVNRSASIGFMTIVALDRYFKVVYPHHWINQMTFHQAGWLTALIWVLVIVLRIPLLTINLLYEEGNRTLCRSFTSSEEPPLAIKLNQAAYVAEFVLPWFLLLFCSVRTACFLHHRGLDRQKKVKRAIQAVCVINLVFTICFLPGIFTGLVGLCIKKFWPTDCALFNQWTSIFIMSFAFSYLNSTLDPLIYAFSSSMFREALKSSFSCLCFKKKNTTPPNPALEDSVMPV
ncbi:hydroxycarboxylic acid receptor 2 isoform X1 [Sphaeramia orbicularis]|uniref:hydroxycarboxylic acid receptor 2 isoform X1 n=1 Tax=Sphaeramia orbicularis TaxID=375764 RepID=UPI001181348C|nr:hydroxycarboxylic acid receptor 2-like isoform X1 [Sphaeramia orbicularis]